MKRKRFTEEQIIGVLREHDLGAKTADLCRKHGIGEATFYNWKSKFGGLDVSDEVERYLAVGTDGDLEEVEFGCLVEADVEGVAGLDHVRRAHLTRGRRRRSRPRRTGAAGEEEQAGRLQQAGAGEISRSISS